MSPAAAPAAPRIDWRRQWRALAPRERLGATVAGAVVVLFLVWLVAVQPAWHTLRRAPAELDRLEGQLQQMQRLAAESRTLREAPTVSPAQATAALRTATQRLGQQAKLSLQGERATVTVDAISGEALAAWLSEVRSAARARPVEAQLTRTGQGYSGTLILGLAGAP